LRWTRHWWYGIVSVFAKPLRVCDACGSIYRFDGHLLAASAARTGRELELLQYRRDMVGLRDSFGAVVVASELTVLWTLVGPATYSTGVTIAAAVLGVVCLTPFGYFAGKVRQARRTLREMKAARKEGKVLE